MMTCEVCERTVNEGWSENEIIQEFKSKFPEVAVRDVSGDLAIVCDDCYRRILELK